MTNFCSNKKKNMTKPKQIRLICDISCIFCLYHENKINWTSIHECEVHIENKEIRRAVNSTNISSTCISYTLTFRCCRRCRCRCCSSSSIVGICKCLYGEKNINNNGKLIHRLLCRLCLASMSIFYGDAVGPILAMSFSVQTVWLGV